MSTVCRGIRFVGTVDNIDDDVLLYYFFFFIPFIILALLSPSFPVVTQIRGHIAGPPPPSPLRYMPSFSIAIIIQHALSTLVHPRRITNVCTKYVAISTGIL